MRMSAPHKGAYCRLCWQTLPKPPAQHNCPKVSMKKDNRLPPSGGGPFRTPQEPTKAKENHFLSDLDGIVEHAKIMCDVKVKAERTKRVWQLYSEFVKDWGHHKAYGLAVEAVEQFEELNKDD